MDASSNCFGLGLFDLLLELVYPILLKKSLIEKVDFDFQLNLKKIFPNADIKYFSGISDIDQKVDSMISEKNYGNVSKFYFYFNEAI